MNQQEYLKNLSYFQTSDKSKKPSYLPEHKHSPGQEETCFAERIHRLVNEDVDPLEHLCQALQRLTNAAWGPSWGLMTLEMPTGTNPDELTLPCITIDMNSREVQEKKSPKATMIGDYEEQINGVTTGDRLHVFRQWYDCVIEFNFFGRNQLECRRLMYRFEQLMIHSAGLLKREGISEVYFLKEIPPRQSFNYVSDLSMKSLMYYYRFETDYVVRTSTIKQIMLDFEKDEKEGFTSVIAQESDDFGITYDL